MCDLAGVRGGSDLVGVSGSGIYASTLGEVALAGICGGSEHDGECSGVAYTGIFGGAALAGVCGGSDHDGQWQFDERRFYFPPKDCLQ